MQTWEYLRVTENPTKVNGSADLAGLGKDGWELVACIDKAAFEVEFVFKRPLPSASKNPE